MHTTRISYYETTTTALANALVRCGQKITKVRNLYSPDRLRELGCRTIEEALKKGLAGEVTYYFENSPELPKLVKAWGRAEATFDADRPLELEHTVTCPKCSNRIPVEPTPEEFMQIACMIYKNARIFNKLWKDITPTVFIPNEGEATVTPNPDGPGYTLKTPGFRMCSLNASKEIKDKLRIE